MAGIKVCIDDSINIARRC